MTTKPEYNTELICAGVAHDGKGKLVYVWHDLKEDPECERSLYMYKLKGYVGSVYQALRNDDRFTLGPWVRNDDQDHPQRMAEWRAKRDAAQVAARAYKDAQAGKTRDDYAILLEPLRQAYLKSDPIGRQVIIAKAIAAITRRY